MKAVDSWPSETDDLKRRYRAYGGVRLCKAWESMPQITIAAMEKLAVGAGVAIALACDWRVLARDAYLYVPEVKIGLNLQWGALPRLISLVGPARAKRITIMCEKMWAEQALNYLSRTARGRSCEHGLAKVADVAKLEAQAAAGRSARESTSATTHRQPTPGLIAAAEAELGDISSEQLQAVQVLDAFARFLPPSRTSEHSSVGRRKDVKVKVFGCSEDCVRSGTGEG